MQSSSNCYKIKSYVLFFLASLLPLFYSQALADQTPDKLSHYVLVSVSPHKFFVEKIAGKTVEVGLMVPAGASSHTYEPTPKQMISAGKADLWFIIGETFETRAGNALKGHNPRLELIDMRKGLDLITTDSHGHHCAHCHAAGGYDLHIWLSARMAKIQAQTIADALTARYPENAALYKDNLLKFQKELDDLDSELTALLKDSKGKTIMVSHPAYAYFCRDYSLEQLSIEFEGKDPTPQQLTRVLDAARKAGIKEIFIQPQYNNKGARLIAKELGAAVIELDPYSENYMDSMREIGKRFTAS